MKKMTYAEYCEKFDSLFAKKRLHDVKATLSSILIAIAFIAFIIMTNTGTLIAVVCCVTSYICNATAANELGVDIHRLNVDFNEMNSNED